MTVQTDISRSGPYDGAGTTGPFTVDFRFLADSHLRVIKTSTSSIDTDLVLGVDYTVSGAGAESGAVTTTVAVALGEAITIIRNVPFTQEADYVNNDAFPAESHEQALDLLTMQTQQIKEGQDRAIALPPTADSGSISTELPLPIPNSIIGWNGSGDGLANVDPSSLAGIISFGSFLYESFNGTGAQTDFPLAGNPLAIGNMDVSVGGVTQRGDSDFTFVPPNILRFSIAPPAGLANVYIRYGQAISGGEATTVTGQTPFGTTVIQALSADAAGLVDTTTAQVVGGVKSFSSSPIVPDLAAGDASTKSANAKFVWAAVSASLRWAISGLKQSTAGSSATMTFGAGIAADSTNAVLMTLAASMSKTTSAWAVGSGNGGKLSAAAIANGTGYTFYLIRRPDTGVVDIGFDASDTTPTLPTNYTQYRRIGWGKTNGSAQWQSFTHFPEHDTYMWSASVTDASAVAPDTSGHLVALSVPTGVSVETLGVCTAGSVSNSQVYFSSPSQADEAPSTSAAPFFSTLSYNVGNAIFTSPMRLLTDTLGRVRYRSIASGAGQGYQIVTYGWRDTRGRGA